VSIRYDKGSTTTTFRVTLKPKYTKNPWDRITKAADRTIIAYS
jgi:hypothetical protein